MSPAEVRYAPRPGPAGREPSALIADAGTSREQRFTFHDQIEIGRDDGRPEAAGFLLIRDPVVSRRHCVLSMRPDGRCVIRDVSLNGTRVDGRRLVPNIEVEVRAGQTITVADGFDLRLDTPAGRRDAETVQTEPAEMTLRAGKMSVATVLVGDIRDFTTLVRTVSPDVVQPSVNRVFAVLSEEVGRLGGTVKEFQGDALVAFWERAALGARLAEVACRSVLELDRVVRRLALDRTVWQVEGRPLHMDWALATGAVMINGFGAAGLSMIGEPMVLAFRLEKFAGDATGRILTCPETTRLAGPAFDFRDLGEMLAKGFDRPDHVFALERERPAESAEAR